jgi:Zn-dependent protease
MLRIGRIAGADVLIDPSLLLIGPLLIFMFADNFDGPGPGRGYALAAIFIVVLYASIFIHELAHLLMGRASGRQADSVVLMLFGGVTQFEEGPRGPGQQFLTAIVGPIASLAVGAASLFVASTATGWVTSVAWSLGVTNIFLGLFNLLPGLPLDGGHALRAIIWKLTGRVTAGIVATAWIGRAVAVALVMLTLLVVDRDRGDWVISLVFAVFVAWMMWRAAGDALKYVQRGGAV